MKRNTVRLMKACCFAGTLFGLQFLLLGCSKNNASSIITPPDDIIINKPALSGRLVYHSYSCYECNDSKIFLYDFSTNTIKTLSTGWDMLNPMNAHFSPDGNKIVFMGISKSTNQWDIFLYNLSGATQPVNLTAQLSSAKNEDPKFSADGLKIILKRDGKLTQMDTLGNIEAQYAVPGTDASMPYFSNGDKTILYAASQDGISSIYSYRIKDSSIQTLYAATGIYAYYPIARNDSSFIFTRWHSASNHHDQLYLGYFNAQTPLRLGFNEPTGDYSDAYPAGAKYIFLSSTRSGAVGGYDLYIADITTGDIWSLNKYNAAINASGNELGSSYHE